MLVGPVLASLAISWNAWFGALVIAGWNIISLVFEYSIMKKIYNMTPALQAPKKVSAPPTQTAKATKGLFDWANAWALWSKSAVFVPGIALAVLYANVFQLKYLAQAYAASNCISATLLSLIWFIAGVAGFSATMFYERLVKSFGLVGTAGSINFNTDCPSVLSIMEGTGYYRDSQKEK